MIDAELLLKIMLYIVLIILCVVFIVFGIKLIMTINKTNDILDDVSHKLDQVDSTFTVVEKAGNFANSISEKATALATNAISKFIKKKKGMDDDYEYKRKIRNICCRSRYWSWLRSFICSTLW